MSSLGNKDVFSKNLQSLMDHRGITRNKLADDLDFKYSTLRDWLKGKTYPRIDKIEKMADYFGVLKSDLIEKRKQYDDMTPEDMIQATRQNTAMIPLVGSIACGNPILADQNIEGYIPTFNRPLPAGTNFWLKCKGTSMEPTIKDGAMVLIHEQPDVENDEIAAVLINGEGTLKRVKKNGNQIILLPDNNDFPPIVLSPDDENKIVGKAIQINTIL